MKPTLMAKQTSPICQVSDCKEPAKYLCIEAKMYYCSTHKHAHGMDKDHPHHFARVNQRLDEKKRRKVGLGEILSNASKNFK